IHDPKDLIRPGMFAEIGLGTDARQAILVPADGVVHIGRRDYVLVEVRKHHYRITEVDVGESRRRDVEVLRGLRGGERVVADGALLMKPFLVRAIPPSSSLLGDGP